MASSGCAGCFRTQGRKRKLDHAKSDRRCYAMNDNRCHCAIYHSVNIEQCGRLAYFILREPATGSYPTKPS